ncbi:GNAT family N-acetyltransferase [Endozoicomonas sp.]|uniref:GNAT family N-acetyltransferase n=1 Tax=Endozoicomonas sp. TaxID=1892382 RepID=UPI00383B3395
MVKDLIAYGFDPLKLDTIGAFTRPDNKASIRVLEKCGFRYACYNTLIERNYYQISPDTFQQRLT